MQVNQARHHPWMPVMLLALLLPLVLIFLYFQAATISFRMFGLSAQAASWLLIGSLIGGMINIPITRRRVTLVDPALAKLTPMMQRLATVFHYYPPATVEEVVAVNVGGAIVPVAFSAYLIYLFPQFAVLALVATIVVAVAAKLLARPVSGLGIALPGFVPPILAALVAFGVVRLLGGAGMNALAPVAYICGTLGTLIGADLLNLPLVLRGGLLAAGPQRLWRTAPLRPVDPDKPRVLSIGGAGVFDGIFLTGILAAFLVGVVH
jgi:uncharacterized membrane protein